MENEVVEKEKMTGGQIAVKVLKIVGLVIFYSIIVMLLLFSIANINRKDKNKDFPSLFGNGFLVVESKSMSYDESLGMTEQFGNFDVNDLIYVKKASDSDIQNLKVGDVITFYDYRLANTPGLSNCLNTHRIVYIWRDRSTNEITKIVTQGDYNVALTNNHYICPVDENGNYRDLTIDEANANAKMVNEGYADEIEANTDYIKGIYTGKWSGGGNVINTINRNFFWFIVLPVLLFFLFEVFMVIRNGMLLRHEKNKVELDQQKEQMSKDLEAQKEAMRQEILAQLKAEAEAGKAQEETKELDTKEDTQKATEETSVEDNTTEEK